MNECEVVGGKLVVARRHPSALFDPVEEPLDLVTSSIEIGTEADRTAAVAFRRDVGPRAFLDHEFSNPIGVIATVYQQHQSWLHARLEFSSKSIVVGFARGLRKSDR